MLFAAIVAVIYVFLFTGDVVLENLILKQNALEELNIPVQTVYGHLGMMFIKLNHEHVYPH